MWTLFPSPAVGIVGCCLSRDLRLRCACSFLPFTPPGDEEISPHTCTPSPRSCCSSFVPAVPNFPLPGVALA